MAALLRWQIRQSGVPVTEAMQTGRSDRCPAYSYKTHFACLDGLQRLATALPAFAYSSCLAQPILLSTFGFIYRLVPQSALPFAHTDRFGRRFTPSQILIAALSQSFKHQYCNELRGMPNQQLKQEKPQIIQDRYIDQNKLQTLLANRYPKGGYSLTVSENLPGPEA